MQTGATRFVDRMIGPNIARGTLEKELETYSAFWEQLPVPTEPYYDPLRASALGPILIGPVAGERASVSLHMRCGIPG